MSSSASTPLPILHEAPAAPPGPPAWQRLANAPLERCTGADLFHDYVLGRYTPHQPADGKLRSLNLLVESFAHQGVEAEGLRLMSLLRTRLGPFRTVWGIKQYRGDETSFGWELYFYDFERAHADLTTERIKHILAPSLTVDAEEPYPLPWHMFSIEFSPAHLRGEAASSMDLYIDLRSYKVRGRRMVFENIYTFHDPKSEIDDILQRLNAGVYFDARTENLARLIPPAMLRCGRLCVANKRAADAVYFSRVPTEAFVEFLKWQAWPAPYLSFVEANAKGLDHLLWDAGMDFATENGALAVRKTGIYGTF